MKTLKRAGKTVLGGVILKFRSISALVVDSGYGVAVAFQSPSIGTHFVHVRDGYTRRAAL